MKVSNSRLLSYILYWLLNQNRTNLIFQSWDSYFEEFKDTFKIKFYNKFNHNIKIYKMKLPFGVSLSFFDSNRVSYLAEFSEFFIYSFII